MSSKFPLKQVTSTKFMVMNGVDTIGSISVEESQVNDLLRCWSGPKDCLTKSKPRQLAGNPFVNALMKHKSKGLSQAQLLRTC